MRILHVTTCYEAGVKIAIDNLVRTIPADHGLLYSGESTELQSDQKSGTFIQRLPGSPLAIPSALQRAVATFRPDIVHLHSSWAGFWGRIRKLDSAVIYQPHAYAFEKEGLLSRAFYWVEKLLAGREKSVFVLSSHERDLAKELNAVRPIVSVQNLPSLNVRTEDIDTSSSPTTIVMIGRLAPQKDPDFFVESYKLLKQKIPQISAYWIGDGEPKIRENLEKNGITVTGWLQSTAIEALLDKQGTVYLHSARYEGFPISVLDAAARRVPIVVRAIPAFAESVLEQVRTPADAAGIVSRLATDVQFRQRIYSNSLSLVDTTPEISFVKNYINSYRQSISDYPNEPEIIDS